ncbi:class I SAM-dependent methyltransferase [Candidatus Dojkabacteria bacterium]|uniref:Class I SAM-dependent methyltransferase n=1 Tax=Candidatus Dojkabacteria bacterium TaxID=2099670 RepID=A0A3M0YZW1_9BACT|nr:MAG: class I SAM-dependent methyltransferase [Candidatus Dojkabacteria bacterium]
MKILNNDAKFAYLGKPGEIFSQGFRRRLRMIQEKVDFKDKKILDLGCGKGVWMSEFVKFTSPENVFGVDCDKDLIDWLVNNAQSPIYQSKIPFENVVHSVAESIPFKDNYFDIVFHNEVLEHVSDDILTIRESFRVLKPGGYLIFFTPNTGWPFETHGIFLFKKYIWGNIPLLPWLPYRIQRIFAPHVRNYTNKRIREVISSALSKEYKFELVHHSHVFPGFDRLIKKFGKVGRCFAKFVHKLEKTPLHFFGISHFILIRKL